MHPADSFIFFGTVIAGFFTGGALAVRGGLKAARNSAIGGAVLLAIFEGVGIAFQRMLAENTRLEVSFPFLKSYLTTVEIDFRLFELNVLDLDPPPRAEGRMSCGYKN